MDKRFKIEAIEFCMVLFLSREDVESAVTIREAVEAVEAAFREIGENTASAPNRPYMDLPQYEGGFLLNMGFLMKANYVGVKIASSFPNNKFMGLPTVASIITLHDPKTGIPLAIMEGGYLTALKTGAAGGVAAKYLSRPDSEVVGVIGAGVQARTQLWAVCVVRDVRKAVVYDVERHQAQKFAEEMAARLDLSIQPMDTVKELVKKSDILITATTSKKPVFPGEHVREGVHVTGIGSFTTDAAEIDEECFKKARSVFIDNWEALEVGDLRFPLQRGVITRQKIHHLSDVVIGKIRGRVSDNDITVFKSVGGAPYDVAVAARTFELAKTKGVGREIEL